MAQHSNPKLWEQYFYHSYTDNSGNLIKLRKLAWVIRLLTQVGLPHGAFKSCRKHRIYELKAHERHRTVVITSGKLEIFFKGAVCSFQRHLAVEFANCNQRLSPPLTPPFREATVADTGLRCRRLRPQRAMRFLYKGKLRNYIYLIIQ